MSGYVTGWVLKHSDVRGAARLVLLVLADHASSDGTNAWPSVDTIQHEARLGARSSVQRALRELEDQGAIVKVGTAGRGQANWSVVMEGPQDAAGRMVQQPQDAAPGAALSAPGGPHSAAQTVLNPPEPSEPAREGDEEIHIEVRPRDPVVDVWCHYVEVMAPRKSVIDDGARALIREALKVATAVECKRAIDGCRASPFHMGQNDRGKKYNRLSQILKGKRGIRTTREQIDLFLDIAEKAGAGTAVTSVDPAKLLAAKRSLLDAWQMPGSEQAQKDAEMWTDWLARHDIAITYDADGRPRLTA